LSFGQIVQVAKNDPNASRRRKKVWWPAYAGRQTQTQGEEERQAYGTAHSSGVMERLFACASMAKAAGRTNSQFGSFRVVRIAD
jgi:hypothetical protein